MDIKINRKVKNEDYKKAQLVYWFISNDKNMGEDQYTKRGGGFDLSMASLDIGTLYKSGQRIKTDRDLEKLELVLDALIPDDFSLDDCSGTIQKTRDYVYMMQGREFPL